MKQTLIDLEQRVDDALVTDDRSGIDVLGYGEISTVLGATVDGRSYACKRLPPGSGSNPTGPAFAGMRLALHNPWMRPEFLLQQTHRKHGLTFLGTLLCSRVMRLHSVSADPTLIH